MQIHAASAGTTVPLQRYSSTLECDQLEPQLPDAKECDRPIDDTVCTLTLQRLFQSPGQVLYLTTVRMIMVMMTTVKLTMMMIMMVTMTDL